MRSFVSSKLTERDALLVLNAINGFGVRRIRQLMEKFGSAADALCAPVDELISVPGIPQASRINMRSFSASDFLEKDRAAMERAGARVSTFLDEDYPPRLREISDPPPVLYMAGALPPRMECAVAIVGSRNASLYGLRVAERFAVDLAELGVPVISGMARGVDTAAHRGALRAGGHTVAVLGCGLDVVYPPENQDMYRDVLQRGCLFSEFPFGTGPFAFNFPRRNRIVSGLSLGVVVVEANIRSGALLTAGFALQQGREVFAVPGCIDSAVSAGPHALIRQGAKPVSCVLDILEDLPLREVRPSEVDGGNGSTVLLGGDEMVVLAAIRQGASTYEAIELSTGLGPSMLNAALVTLELKKRIIQKPGRTYAVLSSR